MIAWKKQYIWRKNTTKKRRQQLMRRIILMIALAEVVWLCAIVRQEAFASEESIERIQGEPIEAEMQTEEPINGPKYSMDLDEEETYMLAKLAMAEAEGESIEGKAMVIMVVLNRVNTEGFPDSIQEVIFESNEKTGVYQFSPVEIGGRWWRVEPNEECWKALELVMSEGWDESEGSLYFEATSNGEGTWHSKNLEYTKTVGKHNFYK